MLSYIMRLLMTYITFYLLRHQFLDIIYDIANSDIITRFLLSFETALIFIRLLALILAVKRTTIC